jgi:elongation factor Ts
MDTLKELREETGLSFAQIKKALEAAGGDKEKALEILGEYKEAQAEKKADREVAVSTVASYVHGSGLSGALVELACETDFVARNDEFKDLAKDIAMHVVAMSPSTLEGDDDTALLKQAFIKDPDLTVEGRVQAAVQKFGENVKITRFVRYGA